MIKVDSDVIFSKKINNAKMFFPSHSNALYGFLRAKMQQEKYTAFK